VDGRGKPGHDEELHRFGLIRIFLFDHPALAHSSFTIAH